MPITHDTAWLEKLHETFVEVFRSNDLKALGDWYVEDAVLLPPGRGVVAGREAIVEFWKGAEHLQDLVFETTDSRMMGGETILREAGNLLVTSRGQGRETFNTAAKYVTVWIKKDSGWKIDSTVWNGAGAAGGKRRRGGGGGGGGGRPGRGGGGGGGRGRPAGGQGGRRRRGGGGGGGRGQQGGEG